MKYFIPGYLACHNVNKWIRLVIYDTFLSQGPNSSEVRAVKSTNTAGIGISYDRTLSETRKCKYRVFSSILFHLE